VPGDSSRDAAAKKTDQDRAEKWIRLRRHQRGAGMPQNLSNKDLKQDKILSTDFADCADKNHKTGLV
jgi:hypothetical protein